MGNRDDGDGGQRWVWNQSNGNEAKKKSEQAKIKQTLTGASSHYASFHRRRRRRRPPSRVIGCLGIQIRGFEVVSVIVVFFCSKKEILEIVVKEVRISFIAGIEKEKMSYVDHTFSISDDSTGTFIVHNKPPVKEIAFAIALLSLGALGLIFGIIMSYNKVGGDRGHGKAFFLSFFFSPSPFFLPSLCNFLWFSLMTG